MVGWAVSVLELIFAAVLVHFAVVDKELSLAPLKYPINLAPDRRPSCCHVVENSSWG